MLEDADGFPAIDGEPACYPLTLSANTLMTFTLMSLATAPITTDMGDGPMVSWPGDTPRPEARPLGKRAMAPLVERPKLGELCTV